LGLFLEAGKRGEEWVEVLEDSPRSSISSSVTSLPSLLFFFFSTFSSTKSITVARDSCDL